MNENDIKTSIEEKEEKIKVLEWDKQRNQLMYSKESYLKKLKKEVDDLKGELD